MKCVLLLVIFLCPAVLFAADVSFSGIMGNKFCTYKGQSVSGQRSYTVGNDPAYVRITELYPYLPFSEGPVYNYTVNITGEEPFVRCFRSVGFGPVSYFIKLSKPSQRVRVTIKNQGKTEPVIADVAGLSPADMDREKDRDSFIISGLIPPVYPNLGGMEPPAKELYETLPSFPPEYHVSKGVSTEIRYPNTPDDVLKEIASVFYTLHNKYSLKIIMGMVSWWSGTPRFETDPDGVPFGDEKYQQICYSPDLEFPYSEKLHKLLGERYNTHFTSTQPNQWSNTPWLTMNSDTLFAFRQQKLLNAFDIIKGAAESNDWIECFYIENEPKYWDSVLDREGAYGERLWADFNPYAVEAAKRDGVTLDPADGLSEEELLWLHKNVSDYNTKSAGMYKDIMESRGFSQRLYSHSLYQGRDVFPCDMLTNKPASEWAVSPACLTGLESCIIPMLPSDIYRIREYGKWTNLNREENDGMPLDLHLYDLRLCYMMGGDYYNSYNWHAIGQGRFAEYTKKFAKSFPYVWETPQDTLSICLPYSLLSFTDLKVSVSPPVTDRSYIATITDPEGKLIARKKVRVPKGADELKISLPSMLECEMNKNILLTVPGAVLSKEGVLAGLDLHEQRLLSLSIINGKKTQGE